MTEHFLHTIQEAEPESVVNGKPLLVYLCDDENDYAQKYFENHTLLERAKKGAVMLRLVRNSADFVYFESVFGVETTPSFYILKGGKVVEKFGAVSEQEFCDLLDSMGSTKEIPHVQTKSDNYRSERAGFSVRQLLEMDRKERASQDKYMKARLMNKPKREVSTKTFDGDKCYLSIKLLDGTPVVHEFSKTQTISDVRKFLDTTEGVVDADEIEPGSSMDHYHIQGPVLPRKVYTEEEEQKTLTELGLCPRATLYLNPVYPKEEIKPGAFKSFGKTLAHMSRVVTSFFDYGMGDDTDSDANLEDLDMGPFFPTHIINDETKNEPEQTEKQGMRENVSAQ